MLEQVTTCELNLGENCSLYCRFLMVRTTLFSTFFGLFKVKTFIICRSLKVSAITLSDFLL